MIAGWLWIVFTVTAAFFQTLRNAMQRELTTSLGTVGATHVRFLFGAPFALVFLLAVHSTGAALPRPGPGFWPWMLGGAPTGGLRTMTRSGSGWGSADIGVQRRWKIS